MTTPAPSVPVEEGASAPAFTLPDQHGEKHRLSDYRGRWVVLYFYPRDATPGCTTEACDFRDLHGGLDQLGVTVLGVSPDDVGSHAAFAADQSLPFPLLADEHKRVMAKYGVWREKTLYGRKSVGVVRTTYLIDPKGKVARRWDNVRAKGHAGRVAEHLKSLIDR